MKNTLVKCTRIFLMMFVAVTFVFTHIIKTKGNSFDLIKETKKLYSENRRDDALVLAETFKGINNWCNDDLAKLEKQLEYSVTEKYKIALWDGVTKGEVYNHYSGLGAMIADMCLWGYIRDLVIEGYEFITRDSSNENAMMLLSGTGVTSFCYPIIDGASVLAKNMEKYLKSSPNPPSGGLLMGMFGIRFWVFMRALIGLADCAGGLLQRLAIERRLLIVAVHINRVTSVRLQLCWISLTLTHV